MRFRVKGNLIGLCATLREVNPSPYMYMLKMSDRCIIGSSPEMLIRITKDYVRNIPYRRHKTDTSRMKKKNEQDYVKNCSRTKREIAEHTMLVDLARNDIGRLCEFGTVVG